MSRLLILCLCAPLLLAGCSAPSVWASDEEVARAVYRHDGPPALTLYTMVNNRTGAGAHTSLMINASQRVIFDPAGSVTHRTIPERNDVLFGVTPQVEDFYTRAHARASHHVVVQRLEVAPEVAELALRRALKAGPVAQTMCSISTAQLLAGLPGLQSMPQTWFPNTLSAAFGKVPGVQTRALYEYDDEDKSVALRAYMPDKVAAMTPPPAPQPPR